MRTPLRTLSLPPALLPALLPLLAAALPAQESRGPFAGLPVAIAADPVLGGVGATTLEKRPGFANPPSAPFAGFDLAAVLSLWGGAGLDADDLSIGHDWIEVDDQTGFVQVPQNQWAALTFSVTPGTQGRAGSRIAAEVANGSADSDLFSYVFLGSALPPELVGRVERAHDRSELGLPRGTSLDAVDQLLPIVRLQPQVRALLGPQISIYFTLSSASALLAPAAWWSGTPPSGATILCTTGQIGATFTMPQPFLTFRDLGLVQADDVTGLALDVELQRVLFSTTRANLDPLQFVYFGTDQAQPVPLMENDGTPTGNPVSTKIGLVQNDGIDAICATDPSVRIHGTSPNPFFFYCGSPRPSVLFPASMNGSACRDYVGGQVLVHTWLNGWPPLTGQGPGVAALFLTFGNNLVPYPMGPLFVRNPANAVDGDPQQLTIPIPASIALGSLPIVLRWFAADAALTELAEAWPVRVEL